MELVFLVVQMSVCMTEGNWSLRLISVECFFRVVSFKTLRVGDRSNSHFSMKELDTDLLSFSNLLEKVLGTYL